MPTQEQLDKLEQELTTAIEAHLASGGKLIAGSFHREGDCLCPIGCLTTGTTGSYEEAVSKKVGYIFTLEDMWDFISGFDLKAPTRGENDLYRLGQKMRQKFSPQEVWLL